MIQDRRRGNVTGLDGLTRRLLRLRRAGEEALPEAVAETAGEVRGLAQGALRRAPGRLPRIADKVDVAGEGAERGVVVRHPAAPFVEFGTRYLPAHPFLQRAADSAQSELRRRIMRLIGRMMRDRS